METTALRAQIQQLLRGGNAHVPFAQAVEGFPLERVNQRPQGLPYSAWDLLEHLRIAQRDILDFMVNPHYKEPQWPQDYWPSRPGDAQTWQTSLHSFEGDLERIIHLALDPQIQLDAAIPHGQGQTYLREFLLAADHNAYHIGQLVLLRRLLGAWG
ncbi:MAG: DinB family protein [Thermaceae bacterium]|nr:DinB family protein [Thermaceae bacterium]